MLESRLVEVGIVKTEGFVAYENSIDSLVKMAEDIFKEDGDEYTFWLNNTDKGDDFGRSLLSADGMDS